VADIRLVYFGQVALEGGAVSLRPALSEIPGLKIALPVGLLSVAGGIARLHFTVSAESLEVEAESVFEIFERHPARVS
jgi:hypothetical protein